MKVLVRIIDLGKDFLAFFGALLSVCLGTSLAIASFDLAFALQHRLWLLLPCLLAASLTPLFLIVIPAIFVFGVTAFQKFVTASLYFWLVTKKRHRFSILCASASISRACSSVGLSTQ